MGNPSGCNTTVLFRDGGGILLVRDHENQQLHPLVRARVARSRMNGGGRLIERVTRLEKTRLATVDRELVGALHHVPERVVSRVAMRRARGPRGAPRGRPPGLLSPPRRP